MVCNDYEEIRKKRLEENNKKIAELRKLAVNLKKTAPKPSPAKRARTKAADVRLTPVRRSGRMADKPAPNYKEFGVEPLGEGRRIYKRRDLLNRVYASDERRVYAVDRAERIESRLGDEFPTFVKPMTQSHVTGGFWLSLPYQFCKTHLPSKDEYIYLMNEMAEEWEVKYLNGKNGLSGGWRGFAIDNNLVDGDALVFELIKPLVFKVYIIRVNTAEEDEEESHEDDDHHENQKSADAAKVKGKKASGRNQSRCIGDSRGPSASKSLAFPVC